MLKNKNTGTFSLAYIMKRFYTINIHFLLVYI